MVRDVIVGVVAARLLRGVPWRHDIRVVELAVRDCFEIVAHRALVLEARISPLVAEAIHLILRDWAGTGPSCGAPGEVDEKPEPDMASRH